MSLAAYLAKIGSHAKGGLEMAEAIAAKHPIKVGAGLGALGGALSPDEDESRGASALKGAAEGGALGGLSGAFDGSSASEVSDLLKKLGLR